eukprot:15436400-Alexandrium_andersonii.AAC.1
MHHAICVFVIELVANASHRCEQLLRAPVAKLGSCAKTPLDVARAAPEGYNERVNSACSVVRAL